MQNSLKNWQERNTDYWVNQVTNWVVKEVSREEGEQWVIIDNNGMMISCEWRDNKEDCFNEADRIFKDETSTINA